MNITEIIRTNSKETLFIFNGSELKRIVTEKIPDINNSYISFNEAMAEGEVSVDILSTDFIIKRVKSLDTELENYNLNVVEELQPIKSSLYNKIVMFFGSDMFCQINMITLMAYLKQEKIEKDIEIYIIDEDSHEIIRKLNDNIKYLDLYKKVLIDKNLVSGNDDNLDNAIIRYIAYHSDENEIIEYIRNNHGNDNLLELLMHKFKDYGLGDTQYKRMINKVLL